ncbi:MAG: alkaline phosphatase family protein, partial [Promethearchaeota archaeon]
MPKKNFILGIDGIPYELMNNLANKGVMPNFHDLRKKFTFTQLKSSIPHISSVSWSSIITGDNPGEHGIYGFTEIIEGTYSLRYPNFNALRSKPFWLNNLEKKQIILNVPSTYPARELNGIHVAGFVALNLKKAVYPNDILPILTNLDYQIDV